MKAGAIIRLVLFVVIIVVLLGVLLAGIGLDGFPGINFFGTLHGNSDAPIAEGTTFQPEDIDTLEISWVAGEVLVAPAKQDEITVAEECADGEAPMVIRQSGSRLIVEFNGRSFGSTVSARKKNLRVAVPEDWFCKELEIRVVSADARVQALSFETVRASSVSGEYSFEDCTAEKVELDTVSGDFRYAGSVERMKLNGASAEADITAVNVPERIEMNSVSGDLTLTLPEGSGFTVDQDSLSGALSSDFATSSDGGKIVSGDGACRIELDGVSSGIRIRKAE